MLVDCIALRTRAARSALKGWRKSKVLATESRGAAAGTSLSVGCKAAESSIFGQPICLANSSHSSMARSGSASRRSRGVNSCNAAVSMLSRIGLGLNAVAEGLVRIGIRDLLIAKRQREHHKHHGSKGGRIQPDRLPVMRAADGVQVVSEAGSPEPDQHADTVGGQGYQALGGAFVPGTGLGVGVNLAGDKEEVIACTVERDANEQHESKLMRIAKGKEHIPAHPGQHAEQQNGLHAEGPEEYRDQEHEQHFGHLTDGLLARGVGNMNLR